MSDTDTDTTADFEDDSSPEEISEAKALGWKSPKEWKGDPPKGGFVKAGDYVERGKTVLPIVRSENARLKKDLEDARQELNDFKELQNKTFQNLQRMSTSALKRQREQLEDKYAASIDAATEVGDKAAVRELRAEEKKALREFDDEIAEKKPTKAEEDESLKAKKQDRIPEIDDWIDANPWFNKSAAMKTYAISFEADLDKDKPGLTLTQRLERTRAEIVKRFPEAFDEPAEEDDDEPTKRKGSPVEGGSRQGGGSTRTAWSRVPAEAQKQADRFIKEEGLFLNKGETAEKDLQKARERYAAQYLENE